MPNATKKAELTRIAKDLEAFVQTYCARSEGPPSDFVDEKCNDAFLMLREAAQGLSDKD